MSLSSKIDKAILEDDVMRLRTKLKDIMNLDKALDQVHSIWIRLKNSSESGIVQCVTCKKSFQFNEIHLGHMIKRRHLRFRWSEKNTDPQCDECNSLEESGNLQESMRDYKISTLGRGGVEQMERDIHKPYKYSQWDKKTLLITRRLQCRELLKDKNFTVNIP